MLNFRVGIGYDIHQIQQKGKFCTLGGVLIPANFSLKGHSDADVVLHSITDAIFGALAIGDIGEHFSDKQVQNHNRNSVDFLQFAYEKTRNMGYSINNIDCNIICEKPKLQSYKPLIRENISHILKINVDQVSIKAKTNEKLDSIGNSQAIACQSIVSLFRN